MTLKAYYVFTAYDYADNWGVLAFSESANEARSLAIGFYDCLVGFERNDEYYAMRAYRLPRMDQYAPEEPSVIDGSESQKSNHLVKLSKIHVCPDCGSNECDWRCEE